MQKYSDEGYDYPLNIGIITSENGFIRKSAEIKEHQETILFNKVKRLSAYGRCLDESRKTKLIDLDYDDILIIFSFRNTDGELNILNYITGQEVRKKIDINSLEFREE